MNLNVPFYKQTTPMNCGPVALKMGLAYLDKEYDLKLLEENVGIKEGFGVATVQIGVGAAKLGFRAELFSTSVEYNEANSELEFMKKYAETDQARRYKSILNDARSLGVKLEEKSLELNELLRKVNEDSTVIILLDWNIIKGAREKGYQGHFVPIVGYDEKNVIVHNHGMGNPKEFMEIPRDIFEEARKAKGTDEDVLVVYRKLK